jgi:exopolyphosphatase / guanosine-5'-triphosphate,3'-diphosphate pyrophosphatase
MKKIAVIDLGTNGFRLQIAETAYPGQFQIIHRESNELKLAAEGIHHIGQAPFERGLAAMKHFSVVLTRWGVSNVKAFGTAALRMADNGQDFMEKVFIETGIEIELITGAREAELIYKGMRLGVPLGVEPVVMIDVGGGSVEFIICNTEGVLWAHSFNVGVTVLKQLFHENDPIIDHEIAAVEHFLETSTSTFLEKIKEFQPKIPVISCGTLDFIVRILSKGHHSEKGGYEKPFMEIDASVYHEFYQKWIFQSQSNLFAIPEIPKDKIEMLAVSLILMDWVMKKLGAHQIIASANSMKAGILFEMSLAPSTRGEF